MLSPQFQKDVSEADYAKERHEFLAGANQAELTTTSRDIANWLPPGEPVDQAHCVLIGVHYPLIDANTNNADGFLLVCPLTTDGTWHVWPVR